ncbi:MAG: hypothetical protein JWN74_1694 [Acidobacteriaceae bacterium]|jgi:hypothetical protein|nr:hypothetical protein [Acidobacteriaceae bacterium]
MATINRTEGNDKQNFKQIESDSWSSIYLPAICAGVVMTIVLFLAVSCSKKPDSPAAKITAPETPAVQTPAPISAAAIPETPKKAAKKHRPTTATYVNGVYGVSLTYPRKYSLQPADKQKEMPVQTSFAKPGAVQVASLDMPDGLYPETDFSSALLNVSVNQGMTEEQCGQFATPSNDADTAKSATGDQPAAEPLKPTTIKLGANQFNEVEQMSGSGELQSDLKYFHLYKNGACYEFALDVETSRKADEDLAQVDRGKVFHQLEKILTTARIKDVDLTRTENADKAAAPQQIATTQPVATSTQEKAQVVTPEQK